MPKIAKERSALEVKRLMDPGWHAVGGVAGLVLQVGKPSQDGGAIPRSWLFRFRFGGKREVVGIGSYPQVSLAQAREQAKKYALDVKNGINPLAKKKTEKSALLAQAAKQKTFKECAEAYTKAHASDYTNAKHRKQWESTLQTYAYPVIGSLLVADITMRHVLDVLLQETEHRNGTKGLFWYTKPETAKRLLDRIRVVLDFATVNEYRSGTNPATWKGFLDTQLPSPRGLKAVKHQPAVPHQEVGTFMQHLRKNQSTSARALEFLIMTAVRSGSVRMAEWSEIDYERELWIIPPEHTKTKQEHRVPLPPQAITLLKALPKMADVNVIFPNPHGKPLSDMALSQLMRGMHEQGLLTERAVPHGFRSTFRDWAAEQTNYADEIRKAASGHTVGDAVKKAYQRSDLLEKRRELMRDWASFLLTTRANPATPGNPHEDSE
jgi:integrase